MKLHAHDVISNEKRFRVFTRDERGRILGQHDVRLSDGTVVRAGDWKYHGPITLSAEQGPLVEQIIRLVRSVGLAVTSMPEIPTVFYVFDVRFDLGDARIYSVDPELVEFRKARKQLELGVKGDMWLGDEPIAKGAIEIESKATAMRMGVDYDLLLSRGFFVAIARDISGKEVMERVILRKVRDEMRPCGVQVTSLCIDSIKVCESDTSRVVDERIVTGFDKVAMTPGTPVEIPNPMINDAESHLIRHNLADSDIRGADVNWDALLLGVVSLPAGTENASKYEDAIQQLLTALFHPSLADPIIQHEINAGRKRIDITYTNMAMCGFFRWLAAHYPAPHVFVECKNYSADVGNPELDQLSGRFSPSRGRFGILVCRSFENRNLFDKRCRDTVKDDRGFVVALDDNDLRALAEARKVDDAKLEFKLLKNRFNALIM